jgi:hypothetical protein
MLLDIVHFLAGANLMDAIMTIWRCNSNWASDGSSKKAMQSVLDEWPFALMIRSR